VRGNRNEKPLYPDRHHPHPDPPPSEGEGNSRVSGWKLTNSLENGGEKGKTAKDTELFFGLLDGLGGSISKRPNVMMRNLPFKNSLESEREW
jgi:hypothetical protein